MLIEEKRLVDEEACLLIFFWNLFLLAYRHISECIDFLSVSYCFTSFQWKWRSPGKCQKFFGCRICLSYLAGSDASGSKGNGKRMMQLLIQRRERYTYMYICNFKIVFGIC